MTHPGRRTITGFSNPTVKALRSLRDTESARDLDPATAANLFRAWLIYSAQLMPFGSLPRRDAELVILRVAWRSREAYEWWHHVPLALRAGLRPDGSPSTYLRRRLDAAADLYARGVAPVVLVSGDALLPDATPNIQPAAGREDFGPPPSLVVPDRRGIGSSAGEGVGEPDDVLALDQRADADEGRACVLRARQRAEPL